MRKRFAVTQFASLSLLLLLAACSSTPRIPIDPDQSREAYELRQQHLIARMAWGFEGRLAVNNGTDGGSGHFNWFRDQDQDEMDFHGALGRGAWRLASDSDSAVLELADGRVFHDRTVTDLVRQQFDWQIPIEALEWWVRGLNAPGNVDSIEFDAQGSPTSLKQFGWLIEFDRYKTTDDTLMPHRVVARRGDQSVKLAIKNWTLSGRDDD